MGSELHAKPADVSNQAYLSTLEKAATDTWIDDLMKGSSGSAALKQDQLVTLAGEVRNGSLDLKAVDMFRSVIKPDMSLKESMNQIVGLADQVNAEIVKEGGSNKKLWIPTKIGYDGTIRAYIDAGVGPSEPPSTIYLKAEPKPGDKNNYQIEITQDPEQLLPYKGPDGIWRNGDRSAGSDNDKMQIAQSVVNGTWTTSDVDTFRRVVSNNDQSPDLASVCEKFVGFAEKVNLAVEGSGLSKNRIWTASSRKENGSIDYHINVSQDPGSCSDSICMNVQKQPDGKYRLTFSHM